MSSTFSGFDAAVSGLFAAQRALDVIGHNIANQATPGYSRQRTVQVTRKPTLVENNNWLGTGVNIDKIIQIRDSLLDSKYRLQFSQQNYWEEVHISLTRMEDLFQEPAGKGITDILDNFFAAVNKVRTDPDDPTARASFATNAKILTDNINSYAKEIELMVSDLNEDVESTVSQANNLARQIASMNKLILESERDGHTANDYRDTRNLLLDQLSGLMDIKVSKTVFEDKDSGRLVEKLNVYVGGKAYISHGDVNEIKLEEGQDHPLFETSMANSVPKSQDLKNVKVSKLMWNKNEQVDMNKIGGKLGAMVQMRDSYGDPSMNNKTKGIAYYARMLNEFTKSFCTVVNNIQKKGFDSYGNEGKDIFVIGSNADTQLNARNVTVNPDILKDPNMLAVGTKKDESNTYNFAELYAVRNLKIDLKINQNIGKTERVLNLGTGTPENVFKSQITAILGVETQESKRAFDAQTIKAMEIDLERMSVSGVSENEELTDMLKYQHAYNASARMITTVDEMLDVIINRMGRVGL